MSKKEFLPLAGILFSATIWGIVWYPYRLLEKAGVQGEIATLVTYLFGWCLLTLLFSRAWREFRQAPLVLIIVALSAGWCNLSYVLGMLQGEVMRVLLLFYLAPLWTVPLARVILHERITAIGYAVVSLAFCGAVVMLWNPSSGLPIPTNRAEWLGLSSGLTFALANVMVRRAANCGTAVKTLSVFSGVVLVSLLAVLLRKGGFPEDFTAAYGAAPLVFLTGFGLAAMSLAFNYGLSNVPATRAIVVLQFELVVAAIASYFWAHEVMRLQEWIGGAMIVAASLFSGQLDEKVQEPEKVAAAG